MPANQDLQTILRESLRAYEQARAAHLRSQQAADAEYAQATAELTATEQTERARLEAEHHARRTVAASEQERLGDLAAAVTALEEAACTALAQAGLAHIAGAPVAVDDPPAKARRGDAEVTQLFVQAQTGYVALREAILKLAQAQVAAGQWDAARQTLKPLLAEKDAPLYEAAFAAQRESYLRPARQALEAGQWQETRDWLAPWLKGNKEDSEARRLERASYLLAARRALETEQWEVVRSCLEPWRNKTPIDLEASSLLRESCLRPARQAVEAEQWPIALSIIEEWLDQYSDEVIWDFDKEISKLLYSAKEQQWIKVGVKVELNFQFVQVPAGAYTDEGKRENLPGYWISYLPVSFDQFQQFIDATKYSAEPWGQGSNPVEHISWDDAMSFCRWAGVALPTELQWVKAVCSPEHHLVVFESKPEWCAHPLPEGGYALRQYGGSPGEGCSSRIICEWRDQRTYMSTFRVVVP